MRAIFKLVLAALAACSTQALRAQDLAPRAYIITPLHSNAITLSWAFFNGDIDYNGGLPISGATGTYSVPIFSYYHSLSFFGRSANVVASLPYGVGNFQGTLGVERHLYRSGLADSVFRFSVNLKGGPAMPVDKFLKWKQKVLLGASLKVVAPTGQYDPTDFIHWGANRWAFKPEFGYSQKWGKWVLDAYMGVWFFTTNQDFLGTRSQSQNPIGAWEGHLSYDFKRALWASLDGNFWLGGRVTVDGVTNPLTQQANSRLGATAAIPIARHQSLKLSLSDGAYTRFGGDYRNVSVACNIHGWAGQTSGPRGLQTCVRDAGQPRATTSPECRPQPGNFNLKFSLISALRLTPEAGIFKRYNDLPQRAVVASTCRSL